MHRYFKGDYESFLDKEGEKAHAHAHRLDARVRQEKAARASAAKMATAAKAASHGKGNASDNLLRHAKQKLAKVERMGLFREDGKRFHTHSLRVLDEAALRLPERVEAQRMAKEEAFRFPDPDFSVLRGAAASSDGPLLTFDHVALGYKHALLSNITAQIPRGRKIAVVGDNGAGKSTLLKLLLGDDTVRVFAGEVRRAPNLRVAYVPQQHAEALTAHGATTAVALCVQRFHVPETEARARLGRFGVTGDTAVLPLTSLSGGQKVRCFSYHQ
jgi:ATP-binding cassette subfamily F protein 3